jgi:uncharacterized membrane protein
LSVLPLFCLFFELHLLIALLSIVCFVIVLSVLWQNRQGTKGQSETVIQRTDKTMAKQTRDKRATRRCNSKNRQNNSKTDKGQKRSVLSLFCLFFELHLLIALLSLVCFVIVLSVLWITSSDCPFVPCLFCHCYVIERTDKTMAKQTRDKRAIRRCNSKNRQTNRKTALSVLPLFCLFFQLHLLIALLSLVCFAIVLSVLWITSSADKGQKGNQKL